MNSTRSPIPNRTEADRLEKLRGQLSSDMEAMHEKEASLREYEQRLRLLIEHTHGQGRPAAPSSQHYHFSNSPGQQADLDAEWEKYNRAHALLEAARRGLADDRLALKAREEQVALREQEVARREAWLKAREQEATAKAAPPPKAKARTSLAAAAKNLLTRGKSG